MLEKFCIVYKPYFSIFWLRNFLIFQYKYLKNPLPLILFILQTWKPIFGNSNKSGFLNHIAPHMVLIYLCLALKHRNRCWTFLSFKRPLILQRFFPGIGRNKFLSYRSFTRLFLMKFVLLRKWISSFFQIFWFPIELALEKKCLKVVLSVDQIKPDTGLERWPIFMSLIAVVYFNFLQMYDLNG